MAIQRTDDTDTSGDRPFPDIPRNPATVRVFALIVGINDYPAPIPKLNGCLRDVEQVEDYLMSRFGAAATETVAPEAAPVDTGGSEPLPPRHQTSPFSRLSGNTGLLAGRRRERRAGLIVEEEVSTGAAEAVLPLPVEVFGRLHLCTLTDSAATYDNIIRGFREHLSHATENDTVWFHFSGHGSEQFAAPEFKAVDPNGRDQTLVCYREPGDTDSQLFLADKELAVLLNELSKNKPHIVVSLDSCHSGSGTREVLDAPGVIPRAYKFLQAAEREDPALLPGSVRTFESYLHGYYKDLETLEIPSTEHVLLSACETAQTAGDMPQGGVFTTSLIGVLNETQTPIHYARLFTRTRARANKIRNKQNPQFETLDGFDPYTCFLEGWPMQEIPEYYEVFRQGKDWYVRCGAIHGLPVQTNQPIKLMISTDVAAADTPGAEKVGAHIEQVGAQHSKIRRKDVKRHLDRHGEYIAEILAMPAVPVYVSLSGELEAVDKLKQAWDGSKNMLIAEAGEDTEAPAISVTATEAESFLIRDAFTGKKFVEVPVEAGGLERRIELTKQNLDKIVRWKRMIKLDNPGTKIRDWFDFELEVMDKDQQVTAYSGKEVKIVVSEDNMSMRNGNGFLGINFRVKLKSNKQNFFLYAFDLSSSCAIKFRSDEEKEVKVDQMNIGDVMPLRSAPYGWGLGPDDMGAVRWFKLLATTEELDYHQLTQPGLIGDKDIEEEEFAPEKISEDWCAETIKVTLVRKQEDIPSEERSVTVGDGNLQINGHAGVEAAVALSTADAGEQTNDPANRLADFEQLGYQMVDLGTAEDGSRQNVLELSGLQVDNPAALQEQPLEFVLSEKLEADEYLLPITFDGAHFRVIGYSVPAGEQTVVRIFELPAGTAAAGENPFGDEPADASLFETLKVGFFKSALRRTNGA